MGDTREIGRIRSNSEYIIRYCHNNRYDTNENLIEKCSELLECAEQVNQMAIDAVVNGVVFKTIPGNGYTMFLRMMVKYTNLLVTQIKAKNQPDQTFLKIFPALFAYRDWLFTIHEILVQESVDGSRSMMTKQLSFSSKACYNSIHMDEEVARLIYSTHCCFWLDEGARKLIKFFIFQIAFATRPPCSFSTLWSTRDIGKYYLKTMQNCSLDFPFSIWRKGEGWLISRMMNGLVNRKVPVISKTLHIPRQKRFILDYKGNILDFEQMSPAQIVAYQNDECEQERARAPGRGHRNKDTIKCRYSQIMNHEMMKESVRRIRNERNANPIYKVLKPHTARKNADYKLEELNNNNVPGGCNENLENRTDEDDVPLDENFEPNPNKVLLLNFPGGGFVAGGSTSAEMYLRTLCNNLGGIPILSVDYSLTVPYPIPNQEILDVYLWLLSGEEEVEQFLGFTPKQIVITGDSAGGFLTVSLTIILNEVNKLIKDDQPKIPLPVSIVTAYPVFSLANLSLTKVYSALEPLLETHLLLIIYSYFGANVWSTGDFRKVEKGELYKKIAEKNRSIINRDGIQREFDSSKKVNDSTPWFQCDYLTYKNRADYINSFYNHPFIAPKQYIGKFDELKSVKLYVFAGDLDGTLDDCTELAMQWKGKTCFDSFDNIMHGFLSFSFIGNMSKEAFDFIIRRYQEACGLI